MAPLLSRTLLRASASAPLRTALPLRSLRFARPISSSPPSNPQPPAPLTEYQPKPTDPEVLQQSPNVAETWSTSQNPKKHVFDSPRFEQTNLSMQPNGLSAMGMVAEDPVRMVDGRRASCDGGGGPLGHPRVFINLDKPGPKACGYCGIRFEQAHAHH